MGFQPPGRLCLVTDRLRAAPPGESPQHALLELVAEAVAAGVDLIQIRERDLDAGALLGVTRASVALARGTASRILVNDRVDVALAAGAHGVHLRAASAPALRVRTLAEGFLVGQSVHAAAEARRIAAAGGVDYLIFGPVFETASKPGAPAAGLDELARAVEAVEVPVLGIGGVADERLAGLAAAGAAGFAAIGWFIAGRGDLAARVASARRVFDTPRSVP